jgi:hypothetical protein
VQNQGFYNSIKTWDLSKATIVDSGIISKNTDCYGINHFYLGSTDVTDDLFYIKGTLNRTTAEMLPPGNSYRLIKFNRECFIITTNLAIESLDCNSSQIR